MAGGKEYQHFIPDVPENPNYMKDKQCVLISSLEELDNLLNNKFKDKTFMSFDIETSDLDPTKGFLVGYSFAFDNKVGYYVPVNHITPPSLGDEAIKLIYHRMQKLKKCFVYNMQFDYNFLEWEGKLRMNYPIDMSTCPYYDLMVGFFLADTNVPFPGLKKMIRKFKGFNAESFEATLGDTYNFHYLDPKDAYIYAATDAIMTYDLAPDSLKFYKEAKISGVVDNEFLYPLTQMLKEGQRHDIIYLKQMLEEQKARVEYLENEIYKVAGQVFNIGSPKQLSDALLSMGIHTGKVTKSGYLKADIDTLLILKRTKPHPIIDLLVEYKQLNKAVSSYTESLYKKASEHEDTRLRYCYHVFRVPSCRLACGKDGKNTYYTAINQQSIPKPHSKNWYVHDYKPGDIIQEGDRVVLDWRFSLTDKSDYIIEALDPHWNMRNAYLPEENSYWVSIDYSTQELKAIANYSKEPSWVEAFVNGGDLHRSVAAKIFHKDVSEVTGDERKKAKSCNFGLSYGMSPYTMVDQFNLSLQECEELHKGWWNSVPYIKSFQTRCIKQAKKTGVNYNYFGRPRRVKYYFSSSDRKQVAFGERTVRNTPIQSVGADLMKMALIKIYKKLLTNTKYQGHCRFLSTIHDESNLSIEYTDRDLFNEMLDVYYNCMYTKVKGWDVPFDVGLEIGTRWGDSFPFTYNRETKEYKPDMKFVGDKKEEPKEEVQEVNQTDDEDISFDIEW